MNCPPTCQRVVLPSAEISDVPCRSSKSAAMAACYPAPVPRPRPNEGLVA